MSQNFSRVRVLLLMLVVSLFHACSADRVLAPPKKARLLTGCEYTDRQVPVPLTSARLTVISNPPTPRFTGNPPPGCFGATMQETDIGYLGDAHSYSGTYSPDFYGQSLTFDDIANSPDSYSTCPDVLTNVSFTMVMQGEIERFQSVGQSDWIGNIAPLSDGYSRAVYQLPFQNMYSRDGKYYLPGGGTIRVVCIQARIGFTVGGLFNEIDVSRFIIYSYTGEIRVAEFMDPAPTSGWAFYDGSTDFSNGSGDGYGQAIQTYLGSGGCTPYWDVWVDGKQVCKNGYKMT
jgi:hypothetical protein